MYDSLKSWINLPVTIRPFVRRDGTGKKVFSDPIATNCYAEGKVQVVTSKEGKEVVSMKRLYFDGKEVISELDNILFEGKEIEITAIGYFYREGVVDIKVVYL